MVNKSTEKMGDDRGDPGVAKYMKLILRHIIIHPALS